MVNFAPHVRDRLQERQNKHWASDEATQLPFVIPTGPWLKWERGTPMPPSFYEATSESRGPILDPMEALSIPKG